MNAPTRIRSKLIIMLLSAVVLPLVVTGAALSVYMLWFHQETAREVFDSTFRGVRRQTENTGRQLERFVEAVREREELVAKIGLLNRYLEPDDYDPLVFGPTLTGLAETLQSYAYGTQLDYFTVYDARGRIHAVYCEPLSPEVLSTVYENGEAQFTALHSADLLRETRAIDAELLHEQCGIEGFTVSRPAELFQGYRIYGDELVVERSALLLRRRPNGDTQQVGVVRAARVVAPELTRVAEVSTRFAGAVDMLDLGLHHHGSERVSGERVSGERRSSGDLPSKRLPSSLRKQLNDISPDAFSLEKPVQLTGGGLYLSAAPLRIQDGQTVWLYATMARDVVRREALGTLGVIGGVLAASALLILPAGLVLEKRHFGGPTGALIDGVARLQDGDYSTRVRLETGDELGMLADALNSMAAQIEQYTETLEQKVRERTQELEDANNAKNRFLARVTHEIRNPMNGVLGAGQLLQHTALSDEQNEYVQMISVSAQHVLHLVNDILDISKIEAGKFELEQAPFDLRPLLDEVTALYKPQLAGTAVSLSLEVGEDVPAKLIGDPGRLRQILANLVSNAAKFTREGEIAIAVHRVESDDSERVVLAFSVSDTGAGIDPQLVEWLFRDYTQARESRSWASGGTGLGLSISQELVELMDGSIEVESTPEEGSTFRFTAAFKRYEPQDVFV